MQCVPGEIICVCDTMSLFPFMLMCNLYNRYRWPPTTSANPPATLTPSWCSPPPSSPLDGRGPSTRIAPGSVAQLKADLAGFAASLQTTKSPPHTVQKVLSPELDQTSCSDMYALPSSANNVNSHYNLYRHDHEQPSMHILCLADWFMIYLFHLSA